VASVDPATGELVRLFHPRRDQWNQHFARKGAEIVGLTPVGRATTKLLNMNAARRVQLRLTLMQTDIW
jgi:hypothetical protein